MLNSLFLTLQWLAIVAVIVILRIPAKRHPAVPS